MNIQIVNSNTASTLTKTSSGQWKAFFAFLFDELFQIFVITLVFAVE